MLARALLSVLVVATNGCAQTKTDFSPYSATSVKRAVTTQAVFAYPGDVGMLREAGGLLIGTLAVGGNGFASRKDVRDRALEEAAALGGTHVFIAGEQANTNWARVTNDRAVTTVSGNTATTTFQTGIAIPVTTHIGSFVIVRVAPEHWAELPRQLNPRANKYALRRIRSKPPTEEAEVSANVVEPAPATESEVTNWYCQSGSDAERCFRKEKKCLAADTEVSCDQEKVAYCYAARDSAHDQEEEDGEETLILRCYGTVEGCRTERDAAFTSGLEIVNECTKSE